MNADDSTPARHEWLAPLHLTKPPGSGIVNANLAHGSGVVRVSPTKPGRWRTEAPPGEVVTRFEPGIRRHVR